MSICVCRVHALHTAAHLSPAQPHALRLVASVSHIRQLPPHGPTFTLLTSLTRLSPAHSAPSPFTAHTHTHTHTSSQTLGSCMLPFQGPGPFLMQGMLHSFFQARSGTLTLGFTHSIGRTSSLLSLGALQKATCCRKLVS